MTTEYNHHAPVISTAICFGEILWDMLPDGPQPGGAPMNVAYHLNKLGIATSMISRIGIDESGTKLKELLDQWGVNSKMLQVDPEHQTSKVIASLNDANEVKYNIVFPVAWDFITLKPELTASVNATKYFIYGSLASRNQATRYTLLKLLETTPGIKVLDVNFRPPHLHASMLEPLLLKADIVKLNEDELQQIQSMYQSSFTEEADQVNFIQDKFQIPEVVITKGAAGASYYKNGTVYHGQGRAVEVTDTIGSGDAFLAAFIAGHYRQLAPEVMLKNAMDMGAFIATKKGGCPDYKLEEYTAFSSY